jgi:hypothetical protein
MGNRCEDGSPTPLIWELTYSIQTEKDAGVIQHCITLSEHKLRLCPYLKICH